MLFNVILTVFLALFFAPAGAYVWLGTGILPDSEEAFLPIGFILILGVTRRLRESWRSRNSGFLGFLVYLVLSPLFFLAAFLASLARFTIFLLGRFFRVVAYISGQMDRLSMLVGSQGADSLLNKALAKDAAALVVSERDITRRRFAAVRGALYGPFSKFLHGKFGTEKFFDAESGDEDISITDLRDLKAKAASAPDISLPYENYIGGDQTPKSGHTPLPITED